jgi:hypothetical protein
MKCPECVKSGQRSKFYTDGMGYSTAMGGSQSYYDEDGAEHYHDVNTHSSSWWCSNGHRFDRSGCPECSGCDYGGYSWKLLPAIVEPPESTYMTFTGTFSVPREPGER